MEVSHESNENFFDIIMGGESWYYGETKQKSRQWKISSSVRPKKARQSDADLFLEYERNSLVRISSIGSVC